MVLEREKLEVERKSFLDFCTQNSKKAFFLVIFLAGVSLTATAAIWSVYKNYDSNVIAVVGNQEIKKKDFDNLAPKYEKFYQYSGNKDALKDVKASVVNQIAENQIVLAEAEKRGISVSDAVINAEYQKLVSNYTDEATFAKVIKDAYDWTPELAKQSIKIRLLTAKLQSEVLNERGVTTVFVRYDFFSSPDTAPTAATLAASKAEIDKVNNELKTGSTFEQVKQTLVNDKYNVPFASVKSYGGINDYTVGTEKVLPASDWAEIKKLKKVGDTTGVIKSTGGFFAVYRLDTLKNGGHDTWSDFIKSHKMSNTAMGLQKLLLSFTAKAFACTTISETVTVTGTVRDSVTNLGINAHVTFTADVNNPPIGPNGIANCVYTTMSKDGYSSSTDGSYRFTGVNCGAFYIIKAENANYLNYKYQYHDSTGWHDFTAGSYADFDFQNGVAGAVDMYLTPAYTITVNVHPSNGGNVGGGGLNCGNGGNICSVKLRGKIHSADPAPSATLNEAAVSGYTFDHYTRDDSPTTNRTETSFSVSVSRDWTFDYYYKVNLTVKKAGTGSGMVTSNPAGINTSTYPVSANYDYNTAVTLTATAATGSTFAGWSVDCNSSGQVTMNAPKTCTATFTLNTYTITPSADTGCTINPSTNQTVNYGANSPAFGGSASTGYSFSGLSIDGGTTLGVNSYTFNNVTANHTIKAKCTPVNNAPVVTLVSPIGTTFPSTSTSVTLEAFSVDDGNSQTIDFQVYGPDGNLVRESNWITPYFANNIHKTFVANGLSAGTYTWLAISYDAVNYSAPKQSYFTIANPPATLSCVSVTPEGGTAPLAVKINFTSNDGTGRALNDIYIFPGDGANLTDLKNPTIYTYKNEGTYTPYLVSQTWNNQHSGEDPKHYCSPGTVTVSNPQTEIGGEKPPHN